MAKDDPYHDWRDDAPKVHHNQKDCPVGKLILSHLRSDGTGGRPLCEKCQERD